MLTEKKLATKLNLFKSALLFIMTSLLLVFSCKDKNTNETQTTSQDTTQATTQDTSQSTPPTMTASNLDEFPVLYTAFQDLVDIFEEPTLGNRKKIVFRYIFDGNQVLGQPTLSGFSVKINGKFAKTTHEIVLNRSTTVSPRNLPYPLYLSNIEMTSDEYKSLKKDANKQTYLVFIPKKSAKANQTNVVVYYTAWSNVTTFTLKDLKANTINTAGDELNPSPPRDPS
jgi:hypothetical protein